MLFKMALRNLARNKRRTGITLFSIGFGLMLSIIFTGLGDSGYTKMINGAAKLSAGHVSVINEKYLEVPSLGKTIRDTNRLSSEIIKIDDVENVAVRIVGQAMISTARDSVGGSFMAVNPDKENKETSYLFKFLKEGNIFKSGDNKGILIGSGMAKHLNVELRDKLVYTTSDKYGEITSGLARVSGIFESGVHELDSYFIMLPLSKTQKILSYEPNEATHLAVFLNDIYHLNDVRERMKTMLTQDDAMVASWRDTSSEMSALVSMDRTMNYLFQVIIFLLITAGILNTILMSVLERSREFGIMLAIGMSPLRLIALIMSETFWLAVFGVITGLIITSPVYYWLHSYGLDFSETFSETGDVAGVIWDTTIYADIRLYSLAVIISAAMIIIMLSGVYPAWKAGKTNPVETIKRI